MALDTEKAERKVWLVRVSCRQGARRGPWRTACWAATAHRRALDARAHPRQVPPYVAKQWNEAIATAAQLPADMTEEAKLGHVTLLEVRGRSGVCTQHCGARVCGMLVHVCVVSQPRVECCRRWLLRLAPPAERAAGVAHCAGCARTSGRFLPALPSRQAERAV
jgi:hypothetical protein